MTPNSHLDQEVRVHPASSPAPTSGQPMRRLASRSLATFAMGVLLVGVVGPSALAASQAPAAAPSTTNQAAGDNETVIAVAAAASPAVVTIETTSTGTAGDGTNGQDPLGGQDPFGGSNPFGGLISGAGSGVVVTADGLILTNRHVVEGADTVSVLFADGRKLDGTVVGTDTYADLALVKVDATDLPTVELGESSDLRVGQLTVAIGSPLGQFPGTVSSGIVSGLDRTLTVADMTTGGVRLRHLIQTDAVIDPGNSGGALLDGDGKLIGINTATADSATGIGFALPIDIAKPIIAQVQAGKDIARPWMGVVFQDIDAGVAQANDLSVTSGAWIHSDQAAGPAITDGSPAADAGLKAEDIVTAIDGTTIDAAHPLDLLLLTHEPGQTVTLTVLRDGAEQEISLTLGTRPPDLGQ